MISSQTSVRRIVRTKVWRQFSKNRNGSKINWNYDITVPSRVCCELSAHDQVRMSRQWRLVILEMLFLFVQGTVHVLNPFRQLYTSASKACTPKEQSCLPFTGSYGLRRCVILQRVVLYKLSTLLRKLYTSAIPMLVHRGRTPVSRTLSRMDFDDDFLPAHGSVHVLSPSWSSCTLVLLRGLYTEEGLHKNKFQH